MFIYCIDGDNVKIEISILRGRVIEIQINIEKFVEFEFRNIVKIEK